MCSVMYVNVYKNTHVDMCVYVYLYMQIHICIQIICIYTYVKFSILIFFGSYLLPTFHI